MEWFVINFQINNIKFKLSSINNNQKENKANGQIQINPKPPERIHPSVTLIRPKQDENETTSSNDQPSQLEPIIRRHHTIIQAKLDVIKSA